MSNDTTPRTGWTSRHLLQDIHKPFADWLASRVDAMRGLRLRLEEIKREREQCNPTQEQR